MDDMHSPSLAKSAGQKICRARERAGLSPAELGARLDPPVDARKILQWESGDRGPIGVHRQQVADRLQANVHDFWPPVDELASMSQAERRLLHFARRGPSRRAELWVNGDREHATARHLVDRWVVSWRKVNGDGRSQYQLTPHGEDILDLLHEGIR